MRKWLCWWRHKWIFHINANPPVIVCERCGLSEPMPYGDDRQRYL